MEMMRIITESPSTEQWRLLDQFTYPRNVRVYLDKHSFNGVSGDSVEFVSASLRQSKAYFTAAAESPMDIAPALLYYGSANLLAAVSSMLTGNRLAIAGHGMRLTLQGDNGEGRRIADTQLLPIDSKRGALQLFCNALSDRCQLVTGAPWTLEEILGSIPDLKQDFEGCYAGAVPYIIPLESLITVRGALERIVPSDLSRYSNPEEALHLVPGLADAFLPAQYGEQMAYIILYHKLAGRDIAVYSMLGRKHLPVAHLKNGHHIVPAQIILMHMGLFVLGTLSRYHPHIWNQFANRDDTGEKLLVDKFLGVCHRYMPNLALNVIYGKRLQFVSETSATQDLTTSLTEDQVRSIVDEYLRSAHLKE